jgi:hypothetical protein
MRFRIDAPTIGERTHRFSLKIISGCRGGLISSMTTCKGWRTRPARSRGQAEGLDLKPGIPGNLRL